MGKLFAINMKIHAHTQTLTHTYARSTEKVYCLLFGEFATVKNKKEKKPHSVGPYKKLIKIN